VEITFCDIHPPECASQRQCSKPWYYIAGFVSSYGVANVGKLGFALSVIMVSVIVTSLMVNIHLSRISSQLTQLISPLRASVDEINSNPSAWVNRTVVVEGKLSGPLIDPDGEEFFMLFRLNATHMSEEAFILVGWSHRDGYAFEKVIVVGVIQEARDWNQRIYHYIRAEEIVRT